MYLIKPRSFVNLEGGDYKISTLISGEKYDNYTEGVKVRVQK